MSTHTQALQSSEVDFTLSGSVESPEDPVREVPSVEPDGHFDALRDATIMMVDDEPITIEVAKMFLEEAGYKHFVTTSESTQAFDILVEKQPDVVLLDLMMPEVNGFEILARVRADKQLMHTPVIVLTSSTDADTKLKALRLGVNDFLAKPVDPSELALRLRNTLAAKVYQDRLAFYDALTDLPNRQSFLNHLDWALHKSQNAGITGAVLKLDLDHFKEINDTLGPRVGDALLKEVAQRLKTCLRYTDTIGRLGQDCSQFSLCRIGGNEFTALFPEIRHIDNIAAVARRIMAAIEPPFYPELHELYITTSIGIAVFPEDGDTMNTVLKHADVAMSHAKKHGGNNFQFYSEGIDAKSVERLQLANQLRKAPERDELVLYYQPKVNLQTGRITGAEALMRWNHPERGLVSPFNFIPLAEEIGIITLFDTWALNTACKQIKAWRVAGLEPIPISVNVTSQSFRQGAIIQTVERAVKTSGVEPKYIKIELTESTIMENANENIEALHRLKEMGFKLSIDDFGTGYSSLSYLSKFPLDELKIDRSFISDILTDSTKVAIVKAIIAMAHSLGLSVVAEGVEMDGQLAVLKDFRCGEYQGFLFSKPVPDKEFQLLLRRDADNRQEHKQGSLANHIPGA